MILIIQNAGGLVGLPEASLKLSSLLTSVKPGYGIILSLMLIFAYVIGYIFRLITPDDLDRISGEHVLKQMSGSLDLRAQNLPQEPLRRQRIFARFRKKPLYTHIDHPTIGDEGDAWPYRGAQGDVYPYYYFQNYLKRRGHDDELLKYVTWGPPETNTNSETKTKFRSKTHVNKMKVETSVLSRDLSAVIESNEAHIRMLSGVWRAISFSLPIQYLGVGVCCTGIYRSMHLHASANTMAYMMHLVLMLMVLIAGCIWARGVIEHLFHYRRVRELIDVVVCYSLAKQLAAAKTEPAKAH